MFIWFIIFLKGVDQDYSKAKEYFLKAAEKGNSDALNNLGKMYDLGKGVEQNFAKAMEYYQKAAERGNPEAFYNISL